MNAFIKVQHVSFLFSRTSKFHQVPILNGYIYLLSLKKKRATLLIWHHVSEV